MNNSISYHLFDTIINSYLIERCGLTPPNTDIIGLVVSSHAQYFSALSFPGTIDSGLRVLKLGNSSVEYEVAIFEKGSNKPAVVGGYTHVFVDSKNRKAQPIGTIIKEGLRGILVQEPARL